MTHKFITLSEFKNDPDLIDRHTFYLYKSLISLEKDYPGFKQWYFDKVVPGVVTGQRDIIVSHFQSNISGILILKNTEFEKKICTLRVVSRFRKKGIGKRLFRRAFEILDTDKPVITVSESRVSQFKPLLTYYGFKLSDVVKGVYLKSANEYVYNGFLDVPIRAELAAVR
jgi:predicted acetyltransferase